MIMMTTMIMMTMADNYNHNDFDKYDDYEVNTHSYYSEQQARATSQTREVRLEVEVEVEEGEGAVAILQNQLLQT